MADPLSIAASVAGLISLSVEVTKIANEYASSVKSAPEEIKELAIQTEALSQVLVKLRDDAAEDVFQPNSYLCSVLEYCESQLKGLSEKLGQWTTPENRLDAVRGRLIRWPLERKECIETTKRLYECAQMFHLYLTLSSRFVPSIELTCCLLDL